MPEFRHFDLRIIKPDFDDPLTDTIIELNHLRKLELRGTTPPWIFFQLKEIFHFLESIGSARIEGNNTTIAEYVESKIDEGMTGDASREERLREIDNMTRAMNFIDGHIDGETRIDHALILQLHKLTVSNLAREGDRTPGEYRKGTVTINNSNHIPPPSGDVRDYMEELFRFINGNSEPKYDLLKTALAHHRFCWIHPFSNGNGRTVRLLTYAMLIKQGFRVKEGRIINPTAVFCADRNRYYDLLELADSGTEESLLQWCRYVLQGLNEEITKIDKLTDYKFLAVNILSPAVAYALNRKTINKLEADILKIAIEKAVFQSADIAHLIPGKSPSERSRVISKLKDERLILPLKENGREYFIRFNSNYLLRGIVDALKEESFISIPDNTG